MNGLHHAASKLSSGKPYRHVQLMPLSTVKRVIDIRETEGMFYISFIHLPEDFFN